MLFARGRGVPRQRAARSSTQHYPRPGWVEHDAEEIWAIEPRLRAGDGREGRRRGADRRRSGSPTSARRSCFWSRRTGRAAGAGDRLAGPADRRALRAAEGGGARAGAAGEDRAAARSLFLARARSPGRSGNGRSCARRATICAIGTVESWLVFKLTGGLHVSDATNASRTALMDIHTGGWDEGLLDLFGVPRGGAAGDRRLRRALWRDGSVRRADPDLRHGRRPAGGGDRPGLPRARARPRRPTAPARSC